MDYFLIIIIVFFLVGGWLAFYISKRIFNTLQKWQNKRARLYQIIIGLVIFAVVCFIGFFLWFAHGMMQRG